MLDTRKLNIHVSLELWKSARFQHITGSSRERSDIDIAIYGSEISFRDLSNIKGELDESDCIYMIDIVLYESIKNKRFKENIDKQGIEF